MCVAGAVVVRLVMFAVVAFNSDGVLCLPDVFAEHTHY